MSGIVVVVVVGAMVGRRGFEERGMGAMMRGKRCINGALYFAGMDAVGMVVDG